jgi:UDP-N-acetylglucosamine acyltransferase
MLMVGSHVGHDCRIGDHCTLINGTHLGGHVEVADGVTFGGLSGVHQFVRLGRGSYVAAGSRVRRDLVPHGLARGENAHLGGLNLVGLRRGGIPRARIRILQEALGFVFMGPGGTVSDRAERARREWGDEPLVTELLDFVDRRSRRGLLEPRLGRT